MQYDSSWVIHAMINIVTFLLHFMSNTRHKMSQPVRLVSRSPDFFVLGLDCRKDQPHQSHLILQRLRLCCPTTKFRSFLLSYSMTHKLWITLTSIFGLIFLPRSRSRSLTLFSLASLSITLSLAVLNSRAKLESVFDTSIIPFHNVTYISVHQHHLFTRMKSKNV